MLSNFFHWNEKKKNGIFHIMPNDICFSLQRFLAIALKLPDTLAWMGSVFIPFNQAETYNQWKLVIIVDLISF